MNAACMLVQSQPSESEIDAVAELCDFWRFNAVHDGDLQGTTTDRLGSGIWNRMEYRPLEGFVLP